MSMKKRSLAEYIDLGEMQKIQDLFADTIRVTLVFVDPDGNLVTQYSKQYDICTQRGQTEETHCCNARSPAVCDEIKAELQPKAIRCPVFGLTVLAVPFVHDGSHLGNWILGQMLTEVPAPEDIQNLAQRMDMPCGELQDSIARMPVYDPSQIDNIIVYLNEIAERLLALDTSAKILQTVIDSSDAAMYVTDYETGEILICNDQYAHQNGYERKQLLGRKCWELYCGKGTFCDICPRDKLLDKNGDPTGPHTWTQYHEDLGIWMRCTNSAIGWVDGRIAHAVTQVDITNEVRLQEQLGHLAYRDRQFGLYNDVKLLEDIVRIRAEGKQDRTYLVPFDIASMRPFNDIYGRKMGDKLLEDIVGWVRAQRFANGELYRIEGDKFCLMFYDSELEDVKRMVRRVLARFDEPWLLSISEGEISYICGVYIAALSAKRGGDDIMSLIERMLESARQKGDLVLYDQEMDSEAREKARLAMSLKNCINNNMQGFSVNFQPIVEVATGTWKGLETLCRWNSPELGPIPPNIFIREAEQMGLINLLGLWVLEEAIRVFQKFDIEQHDNAFVTVNLSPVQLMDTRFADQVLDIINHYDFPGDRLVLEVTESTEFEIGDYTARVIARLRERQIRVALDDFGTGYSSFGNLRNIPAQFLKTEREFVTGIETDSSLQFFNYFMSEIAHANEIWVIVEGVETAQQLEKVLKNGADYIQGFYFSKPLTEEQLSRNLHRFTEAEQALRVRPQVDDLDNWLMGKDAYSIAPSMFRLLNKCIKILLTEPDIDAAFDRVLGKMGEYFRFSRAGAYVLGDGDRLEKVYVWRRPGAGRSPLDMNPLSRALMDRMKKGDSIITPDVDTLGEELATMLRRQGIASIAVLPLRAGGEVIGYIGFDENHTRDWLPEEIIMLWNLCMMMGNSIEKGALIGEIGARTRMLSDVMDSTGLNVYVTDIEKRNILWANKSFLQSHGGKEAVIGTPCYRLLQNRDTPCAHCTLDTLLREPELPYISYEHHNEHLGRDYLLFDSVINWQGGQKVHMEFGLDITEMKKAQRAAHSLLSGDILSRVINRQALLLCLHTALCERSIDDGEVSLSYVKVSGGDNPGEQTSIAAMADTLQRQIRESDIVGRVCEDEFVVVMRGCDHKVSQSRLAQARTAIEQGSAGVCTIHYGSADSGEAADMNCEAAAERIIELARARLESHAAKIHTASETA